MSYSWLKLPYRYRKDPKFQTQLDDGQKWRFLELYLLAHEYRNNGFFIRNGQELTIDEIAYELHRDPAQVQVDLEKFRSLGMIPVNGRGPYIAAFSDDQGPVPDKDRKQQERDRKSQDGHAIVTNCDTESRVKSQESRVKIKESEESEEESVSQGNQAAEKQQICTAFGIPPKFSRVIIADPAITTDDLLSDLTRQYSRKKDNKVKNPGYITGMNLSKDPPEKPAPEWYERRSWKKHLPGDLLEKLDLADTLELRGAQVKAKLDAFLSR